MYQMHVYSAHILQVIDKLWDNFQCCDLIFQAVTMENPQLPQSLSPHSTMIGEIEG